MQALVSHRNAFFMWKDYKRFILSESAAEELFSLVLKVIPKNIIWNFHFHVLLPGIEIQESYLQNIFRNFHFFL